MSKRNTNNLIDKMMPRELSHASQATNRHNNALEPSKTKETITSPPVATAPHEPENEETVGIQESQNQEMAATSATSDARDNFDMPDISNSQDTKESKTPQMAETASPKPKRGRPRKGTAQAEADALRYVAITLRLERSDLEDMQILAGAMRESVTEQLRAAVKDYLAPRKSKINKIKALNLALFN